jgi:hypothetical protein
MKGIKFFSLLSLFIFMLSVNSFGQNIILGSKHMGTEVQEFGAPAGEFVDGFTVAQVGEYAVLTAYSATSSGEVFRTKLKGMEVDEFIPTMPGHINQFTIGGPDGNGYVCLIAHSSSTEFDTIFKTKMIGSGVQEYAAPMGEYIDSIGTIGPDADGYVYLVVETELGIFELTEFSAVPKKSYVLLKWRTETEKDSYRWLIQRKESGGEYTTIGTMDAQGNASHPTDYRYEDRTIDFGKRYFYKLVEIDISGNSTNFGPLFVDLSTSEFIPKKMYVNQNFPNPFARMTSIKFGIPIQNKNDIAKLVVYDVTGRIIKTLVSEKLGPGHYLYTWNGRNNNGKQVTSGVYFYRLNIGDKQAIKKMLYMR